MTKLKNLKDFYEVIESNEKIIVYWYTVFCPDCIMMKASLGKLEKDFPEYKFYSINRDKLINLAKHLEIYGIPSFLVFDNGDETGRLVNKLRKSYKEVKTFIDNTISK